MKRERRSASFFVLFSMAGSFWQHPSMILDLSKKIKKNVKNDEKNMTRKPKKHSTDQNTEPIHEWRLAFCITFYALFDGGELQGPSLNHSAPFGKNFKKNRPKNRKSVVVADNRFFVPGGHL